MRIITFILGTLLLVGGIYCMFAPIATYSALSWLIGLSMVVEGVGCVITWLEAHKKSHESVWTLIGGIISIVLGVFLLGSFVAQMAIDFFIAYLITAWLIVGGIARIVTAISLRNHRNLAKSGEKEVSWVFLLVMGILTIILGFLCFFNPLAIMATVGLLLGISIVCVGVDLIVVGTRM